MPSTEEAACLVGTKRGGQFEPIAHVPVQVVHSPLVTKPSQQEVYWICVARCHKCDQLCNGPNGAELQFMEFW